MPKKFTFKPLTMLGMNMTNLPKGREKLQGKRQPIR